MRQNYYTNNRKYKFETKVLSSNKDENGYYQITLDGTYFYPEGGGQPADKGTINGIDVIDVQKIDNIVYHKLKSEPQGNIVQCTIDKDFHDHYMIQHTGQHLLSAVLKHELDIDTLSVHLGEHVTTIEINRSNISTQELYKLEDETNNLISSNKKVIYHETDDEGLLNFNIRRTSKYSGYIRIVEIEDYDTVPCGGVHLSNLYELGLIKVSGYEKIRGHIRLNFLIGKNALVDYRNKSEIITKLNRELSTTTENIIDGINTLKKNISSSKMEIKTISNIYSKSIIKEIKSESPSYFEFTDTPVYIIQKIVSELTLDLSNPILIINKSEKINWFLINSKDKSIDFQYFKTNILPLINGKGGGREPLWQGSGESSNINEFITNYKEYIATI